MGAERKNQLQIIPEVHLEDLVDLFQHFCHSILHIAVDHKILARLLAGQVDRQVAHLLFRVRYTGQFSNALCTFLRQLIAFACRPRLVFFLGHLDVLARSDALDRHCNMNHQTVQPHIRDVIVFLFQKFHQHLCKFVFLRVFFQCCVLHARVPFL